MYDPPTTSILTGVALITAGDNHNCVILSSTGAVVCWGSNNAGQLGLGFNSSTPVFIPDNTTLDSDVVQVGGGTAFTCALTATGDVFCWGANSGGQLVGELLFFACIFKDVKDYICKCRCIVGHSYYTPKNNLNNLLLFSASITKSIV